MNRYFLKHWGQVYDTVENGGTTRNRSLTLALLVLVLVLGLWFAQQPAGRQSHAPSQQGAVPEGRSGSSRSVLKPELSPLQPADDEPGTYRFRSVSISVELDDGDLWVSADCMFQSATHQYGSWLEIFELSRLLVPEDEEDAAIQALLMSVVATQFDHAEFDTDAYEKLYTRTSTCPECTEITLVSQLVLSSFTPDGPSPEERSHMAERGLSRWPDSPLSRLFLIVYAAHGEGGVAERFLDSDNAGLREEAALRLVCDDEWVRNAEPALLERVEATIPSFPPSLRFPIASAWATRGEFERSALALGPAESWVQSAAGTPECIDGPVQPLPPGLPPGLVAIPNSIECSTRVDGVLALVAGYPPGTSPSLEDELGVRVRRALRGCAPIACGRVSGSWEDGQWTWRTRPASGQPLEACVRSTVEPMIPQLLQEGQEVVSLDVTGRQGCP